MSLLAGPSITLLPWVSLIQAGPMSARSISWSCNLSWSSLAPDTGAYLGFIIKVAIPQQNAQRSIPKLTHCSRDPKILNTLYHSWQTIQHTRNSEQPFPRLISQRLVFCKKLTSGVSSLGLTGPSAFRNSRYSCVVEPPCSDLPPIMLRANSPRFCSVSLCQNWFW